MDLTVPKVTEKNSPSLIDFNGYLNTVSKEDALESIKNLVQMESEDWFRIGMVLSSYRKSKGDEEFKNLLHYAEEKLNIKPRKAYYLKDIYDNLVASNITPSQVSQIGWSKLKDIAQFLTPDTVNYWIDICKTNSVKQIQALLKSNATTNISKAGSIEDALADTPVTSTMQVTVTATDIDQAKDISQEIDSDIVAVSDEPPAGYSGICVGYDFSKDSDTTAIGYITDGALTGYAKYEPTVVEPTFDYPVNKAISEVIDINKEPKTIEGIESITIEAEPVLTVPQLAARLKIYDLYTVLATITSIFPHIKITVTEAQNATNFD
jgi:hypothetical protein